MPAAQETKLAHIVIIEEIRRHFSNHADISAATGRSGPKSEIFEIEQIFPIGTTMEMGGACALLDILPLIAWSEEEKSYVTTELKKINQEFHHALIGGVINQLTSGHPKYFALSQ
jgi:hypothetical protein